MELGADYAGAEEELMDEEENVWREKIERLKSFVASYAAKYAGGGEMDAARCATSIRVLSARRVSVRCTRDREHHACARSLENLRTEIRDW